MSCSPCRQQDTEIRKTVMIRFLRGEYLYYESGAIVIETRAGIGFRVFVSDTSSLLTAREGDEITA